METDERGPGRNRRSGEDRRKNSDELHNGEELRSGKDRRNPVKRPVFVRCSNCFMVNRVPQVKLSAGPKCGNCKTLLEFPQLPVWARKDSIDRAIAHWPETLLMVFTGPYCVHSRITDPVIQDLAEKRMGFLKVMKVDIDSEPELARRFKIEKTPTFIVYKNAEQILRVDGAPKVKTDIVMWVENLIDFSSY